MSALVLAAAAACGHLPFDELPVDANLDGEDGSIGLDGSADGGIPPVELDGGPVIETDGAPPSCGTVDCAVYVAKLGRPTNPGTIDAPVDTIDLALKIALAERKSEIRVGAGEYAEAVELYEGVSLRGGYACSAAACDFSRVDPKQYVTKLMPPVGGRAFGGVLRAGSTITRATVVDGFSIVGESGTSTELVGAIGVAISGGAPTLSRLQVQAGRADSVSIGNRSRSVGVLIVGPTRGDGPKLTASVVRGGSALTASAAIVFETAIDAVNGATHAEISDSHIVGGLAAKTFAIYAAAGGERLVIKNNVIDQNQSTSADAATAESWAIRVLSATAVIDGNQVNVSPRADTRTLCPPTVLCGNIDAVSSNLTIINNVLAGFPAKQSCAVRIDVDPSTSAAAGAVGNVRIVNNTLAPIGSDTAGSWTAGVVLRNRSNVPRQSVGVVRNNIIHPADRVDRAYAIYESDPPNDANVASIKLDAWDHNALAPAVTHAYRQVYRQGALVYHDYTADDADNSPNALAFTNHAKWDCLESGSFRTAESSDCVNAGTGREPDHDLEGKPRPRGEMDIGAYEQGER